MLPHWHDEIVLVLCLNLIILINQSIYSSIQVQLSTVLSCIWLCGLAGSQFVPGYGQRVGYGKGQVQGQGYNPGQGIGHGQGYGYIQGQG